MNEDNSEYKHRLEVLRDAGYEHLYFSFWQSYYEQGQELPDLKMRCAFYEAILRFGLFGEVPAFSDLEGMELVCLRGMWRGAWPSLKDTMTRFLNKAEGEMRKKNREQSNNEPETNRERANNEPETKATKERRKEGKRKEGKSIGASAPAPSVDFQNFQRWIDEHAAEVAKMQQPFTEAQFQELRQNWPSSEVRDVLEAMSNTTSLTKKYKSAYKTCKSWLQMRKERRQPKAGDTVQSSPRFRTEGDLR